MTKGRGKYLTSFLGYTGEGSFHSSAVGVITPTHATLILHLVGANFPVTAHFLKERERDIGGYARHIKKKGRMCFQARNTFKLSSLDISTSNIMKL